MIAAVCVFMGLLTPILEFIPFSAQFAGAALIAFGFAVISGDGLFALLGYLIETVIAGCLFTSF